ncbi:hypothetical protein HLY00_640 [Mycolicibacterium hippocampi]|uniref:Uncharacterized protein n=1 Tax=Mycolicibacterium hippocampi TaxID=659824 RepID=A0A850PKF7_9MYCO|nr:hypothetical protein [Mycolicibacterium hippocampi]
MITILSITAGIDNVSHSRRTPDVPAPPEIIEITASTGGPRVGHVRHIGVRRRRGRRHRFGLGSSGIRRA